MYALKTVRPLVREEIYKRISLAWDYILAFYKQPLLLAQIARIACMSPNHLLRNYAAVFGLTPHQHITELRLNRAKQLLLNEEHSITDISFELGFQTPVYFSKMFKQRTGLAPSDYRRMFAAKSDGSD
ncbi:helix-turn-helix domain-containing protein [Paenibacillus caui]|uniref:helix-turn-helix domain-containing protein n=1 Tax=Paenibacillus caui TaxID=2873927 RepID=UPI001CA832F6|nr:AraC family transcriptional regulator [Paenibacillus caui]